MNSRLLDPDFHMIPSTADQEAILQSGMMVGPNSCLLSLATGSGKTRLAQEAMQQTIEFGKRQGERVRVAYIAPIKALAEAQYQEWSSCFDSVGIFNGDHNPQSQAFEQAEVLILTPEKLDSCLRSPSYHPWLDDLRLLVVDEIHTLGDQERGARLEGVILRLQVLNPLVRILGLSATVGNSAEIAGWLEAVRYESHHRSVPLQWQRVSFYNGQNKLDRLIELILADAGIQTLVFCQSKRRTEELAAALVQAGIAADFHHAGRYATERSAAEHAFRNRHISVLCATTSLGMGMNLPARQVIVYDLARSNGMTFQPLDKRDVMQLAGRAGRPGYDTEGLVTLFVHRDETQFAQRYENEQVPCKAVVSQLEHPSYLSEQILVAIESGCASTIAQLERFMSRSLAAIQGRLPSISPVVHDLMNAGMITSERGWLKTTALSQVAVKHLLNHETLLCLSQGLRAGELTFLDLLILICACPDFAPLLAIKQANLPQLSTQLNAMSSYGLALDLAVLQRILDCSANRLLRILHTAVLLRRWTQIGNVEQVAAEARYPYPAELDRAIESSVRLLNALEDAINAIEVVDESAVAVAERIEVLNQMIQTGMDEQGILLTRVPGLGEVRAKALWNAGVRDIRALADAEIERLIAVPGIAYKSAIAYRQNAETIAKQINANRYREALIDAARIDLFNLWLKTKL